MSVLPLLAVTAVMWFWVGYLWGHHAGGTAMWKLWGESSESLAKRTEPLLDQLEQAVRSENQK